MFHKDLYYQCLLFILFIFNFYFLNFIIINNLHFIYEEYDFHEVFANLIVNVAYYFLNLYFKLKLYDFYFIIVN